MNSKVFDGIQRFFSEVLGTFILLFLGCMGLADCGGISNSFLQMIFNFGLSIMIAVQICGSISGSHINPSVTLSAFIIGRLKWYMAILYIIAQIVGAISGYGLLLLLTPDSFHCSNLCVTMPRGDMELYQSIGIEVMITFLLILFCCSVWDPRHAHHGDAVSLKLGLAIGCLACSAGQLTGASMNPARSLAPAIFNNVWTDHWIYWVGPMSGSIIATLLYKFLFLKNSGEDTEYDNKV